MFPVFFDASVGGFRIFPDFCGSKPFPLDFWLRESSGPKTTRKMLAAPQHSDFQHSRFQEVDPSNGLSVSCVSTRPELKTLQEKHTTNERVCKGESFLTNWGFLLHSFGEVVSKNKKKLVKQRWHLTILQCQGRGSLSCQVRNPGTSLPGRRSPRSLSRHRQLCHWSRWG